MPEFHANGIIVALWTPSDASGQLLEAEMASHLQFLSKAGVSGFWLLGSTGQFLNLDPATRRRVMDVAVARAGDSSLAVNISDLRPAVMAELGRHARSIGIPAVAIMPPYFYSVAAEDIVEFFVRAGEEVCLPILLYNFPERTGNPLTLDIISAVADRVPLAGVKHSGGDFDFHRLLVELAREKNFAVLTGSDTRLAEAMDVGVTGCVSGLANAIPECLAEIYLAKRAGNLQPAQPATEQVRQIGQLVGRIHFPHNIAALMEARGLATGQPKQVVSTATRAQYSELVGEMQRLFHEWGVI